MKTPFSKKNMRQINATLKFFIKITIFIYSFEQGKYFFQNHDGNFEV